MDQEQTWRAEYDSELARAEAARAEGNEGMARVCARRAAGVAVRAFFRQQGIGPGGGSILQDLKRLVQHPQTPEAVRGVASHFLLRITPDHRLPGDADLIADVRLLAAALFPHQEGQG